MQGNGTDKNGIELYDFLVAQHNSELEAKMQDTNANNISTEDTKDRFSYIRVYLERDTDKLVSSLSDQGIDVIRSTQNNITSELEGNIVQLITDEGYLRYVLIKKIMFNGKNSSVIVFIGKLEKTMSLEEFKELYTGIVLKNGTTQNPMDTTQKIIEI